MGTRESTPCADASERTYGAGPLTQKEDDMSDPVSNDLHDDDHQNTQGTPGADEEADTASGGAPEEPDED